MCPLPPNIFIENRFDTHMIPRWNLRVRILPEIHSVSRCREWAQRTHIESTLQNIRP